MNQTAPRTGSAAYDMALFSLIKKERLRQELVLRLIPSENYVSRAVLEATGSVLTNKYSEGYPGRRYYQGLEVIDQIERLTIDRAKALFGADHANVQPYSGSIAVLACYFAVCEPGDRVLGPRLDHGGHLSHGHKVNITGKLFNVAQYSVSRQSERFEIEEIRRLALDHRPKMIIIGGTAIPRTLDFSGFSAIAKETSSILLADISHPAGLIAGNAHPNPFPHADIVVSTSHKTLRGPRGAFILAKEQFAKSIDKAVFPLLQGGPHQHTQAGISAAFFEALQPSFSEYAHRVVTNTSILASRLSDAGLRLVSGGTDNHLILADVTSLGWPDGKEAAECLEKAGLIVNANTIPFDSGSPQRPSGIRLGAPALTTRGMGPEEMRKVADLLIKILTERNAKDSLYKEIRNEACQMCLEFPVPDVFA